LSIAYVSISFIDIAHTLAYRGVNLFSSFDSTSNLATQLWVAARYIQALSLLLAPIFLSKKMKNVGTVFLSFFFVVVCVFASIFYLRIFPTAYVEGVGLTIFKIWSEYIISLILVAATFFLYKKRKILDSKILFLVLFSMIFTIVSELFFTTYFSVSSFSNMLGHFFKLLSFLLLYKTIVEIGLKNPLAYIFRNMEQNAEILRASESKYRLTAKIATEEALERKRIDKELIKKNKTLEKMVENLKIFQSAIDNAFTHIVITDENGSIIYANKSVEDITGFNQKEIIGRNPSIWGKQMPPSFYKNLWKTIKEDKKVFVGEITNKRKDGGLYQADVRVSPILDDDGNVKFFVGLEKDITKEKDIDRHKDEFLSMAAHQLRTPLASISLTTEMLMRNIVGNMTKENQKYLKSILAQTKNMSVMIQTFLNISRIEMDKFEIELEPVNLFHFLENSIKDVLPQIKSKKINLKKQYNKKLSVIKADKRVIKIILENLLSNAIKYSKKGGDVTLLAKEVGNNIIIEVSDDGIGIPKEDQEKIFTKMFRARNVSEFMSEGSGFGLYLVKNLVEDSGYKIGFRSKKNKGTTFTVEIPL
jgi:PAS domain S-box-containing protein